MSYYGSADLEKTLINKTIESVQINDTKDVLIFKFTDGVQAYLVAEGTCCSSSWIEHCSNANELAGAVFHGSKEIDLIDSFYKEDEGYEENIKVYSIQIWLKNRPAFEIEFRNSSNGYYGGYMTWETELSEYAAANLKTTELTQDF